MALKMTERLEHNAAIAAKSNGKKVPPIKKVGVQCQSLDKPAWHSDYDKTCAGLILVRCKLADIHP